MCQMTCVRLQHCRFTLSTEGAARRCRSEAVREGLHTSNPRICPKGLVHPPEDADVFHHPHLALLLAPGFRSAPYEGRPVDGKRNNPVNSAGTKGKTLWKLLSG